LLPSLPLAALLLAGPGAPATDPLAARGEYVFRACDCKGCHTDPKGGGKPLAGGRPLETDFGTFYPPNITPDPDSGIGNWSELDFVRSMREGLGRRGEHLYPSFPYPAYTRLGDEDLHALWAYLRAQPPVRQSNRPHDLRWLARLRPLVGLWKALYFRPGPLQPDPARSASWNRGAYLAEAAAHCGECHTPRTALGGLDASRRHGGTAKGPEGSAVPNITPDRKTGIGRWSRGDIATYLGTGLAPSGDSAGGLMAEKIDDGLRYLRADDLAAIAEYLMSVPPLENQVRKPKRREKGEFE
jgi:mono/diheme cytochrome c family protein